MPDPAHSPPVALVASHHEWVARSLDSILAPGGYVVLRASRGRDALIEAQRTAPDLFLIDFALPDISGVDLCREIRARTPPGVIAPVVITAEEPIPREVRLAFLRAGAWDYIVFPWDAEELLLKLDTYLHAKAQADSLREVSLVDPETGCYSARGLLRRAHEISADANRNARAMACVTLAPDVLSEMATSSEEPVGDGSVVRELGRTLEAQTRESDSVGRIGQSEFVVLAPDTDARGALRLAERLTGTAEALFAARGAKPTMVRAGCFGVQNYRDAAIEPVEMMTRATLALRQSQVGAGSSRIQFFRS